MEKYDALKLEKQLCFPLYAVSKEIVKKYKPYLHELENRGNSKVQKLPVLRCRRRRK